MYVNIRHFIQFYICTHLSYISIGKLLKMRLLFPLQGSPHTVRLHLYSMSRSCKSAEAKSGFLGWGWGVTTNRCLFGLKKML